MSEYLGLSDSVRNKWIRIVWAKWLPVLVRTQPRTERPEVIRVVSRLRRGLPGATAGCDGPHVASPGPARIEPLSPARYKVQFTATAELRDKLERLTALMRSSVPDGDLAAIIDTAVTEKLERLEARRFGRTKAPRRRSPSKGPGQAESGRTSTSGSAARARPTSRYVPAEVRRAVHERDEARCRDVDDQGRRCTERVRLEFHRRRPFGVGGDHASANVSLLCEAHNRLLARIDFGPEAVDGHRRTTGTVSSTPGKT